MPPELSVRNDTSELCAQCGVIFEDLRAWSHHAFKRHGRINLVRRLASGSQCPVCLKLFKANKGLCNHLSYSTHCRHALINAGADCTPEPGTGSRKFDDGSQRQQPAVQAQGPGQCWDFSIVLEEPQQPCETTLLELETCFCTQAKDFHNRADLLQRFKVIFSGRCLQRSRLQATALKWLGNVENALLDEDFASVQWATWHARIARFLANVDFIEWLGEGCADVEQSPAAFRNAEVLFPWLEFSEGFVEWVYDVECLGWGFVPDNSLLLNCLQAVHGFRTHGQCMQSPTSLDFVELTSSLPTSQFVFLSCEGLLTSLEVPRPLKSFRSISTPLCKLRLVSDLFRGGLFLWAHRVPSCLLLPAISCPVVEVIRKIAPTHKTAVRGELLANFCLEGVASCFTVLI